MGLNALVVLLLADGSVMAVDLSGHVAATEVAAEEWPKLVSGSALWILLEVRISCRRHIYTSECLIESDMCASAL